MKKSKCASAQIVSPSLKCKKDDFAMILHGPYTGSVVKCVGYAGTIDMSNGEVLVNAWEVDHWSNEPDTDYFKEDRYLLPIRPGDLEEEETCEIFSEES